ncbi:hypothetical protein LTR78_006297 [Recurvomyces mirabilis]|uniref:SET domain-containing protein n=1 Tax=Recurvomyces mirabilis TaxID=574656 RepID=A0AAE0WL73_9PEZI|nr:hypothetical protein LTR78_006297 [Recurvomyces mirabilis]KAK5152186.1 hypothetical protein LTS14_008561 [Recurvomyces mirabilis]
MNGHTEQQPSNKIALERSTSLYLLSNTPKGRGVFASHSIPKGTIIDTCPVLILDPQENATHVEKTALYHYTYNWPLRSPPHPAPPSKQPQPANGVRKPSSRTQAVVLGLGSMFNHSTHDQNVVWTRDLENELVIYRALRDVAPDEELCISYGDHLTFVDAEKAEGAKEEEQESEEDMLGRIGLG